MILGIRIFIVSLLFLLLDACSYQSLLVVIKPPKPYSKTKQPVAPNYTKTSDWHRRNLADTSLAVDVFFVHPTTYVQGKYWNQELGDPKTNERTEILSLQFQASIFYQDYRVFAPKYRQAIFYSFVDKKEDGKQAITLAYGDVKKAFLHYLNFYNQGRPFILAAHSQGAKHVLQLLQELKEDKRIRSQLVVAYLLGWSIPRVEMPSYGAVQSCDSASQTGCMVSWNTEGYQPKISLARDLCPKDSIFCVNPLNWSSAAYSYAPKQKNMGALLFDKKAGNTEIILYYCDAKVEDGVVKIKAPSNQKELQMPMGKDNYHLYDFTFFYENIKQNAQLRTAAYFRKQPKATKTKKQ